ncbi:MAG: stage 0 sporulation protein [Clostridiales bacterium]|nr:MAG: stage 0 sporulation protein [Clostridiales bacterium]
MKDVVGVKLGTNNKVYYFDPDNIKIDINTGVVVETARGLKYAKVVDITRVDPDKYPHELKKILRIATSEDILKKKENDIKEISAFEFCKKTIEDMNIEMKLLYVEYTLDVSKIIFYFIADERVDFRELVKVLAGKYKTRIELRQIGVRDEARKLGGIGSCGRALCCATWMQDFVPVSINMAKTQNLSLNPSKISGRCGRLMCCLKYEQEHYKKVISIFPPRGSKIEYQGNNYKVLDINFIKESLLIENLDTEDSQTEETNSLWLSYEDYCSYTESKVDSNQKNKNNKKKKKKFKNKKKKYERTN